MTELNVCTLMAERVRLKFCQKLFREEPISLVSEPNSQYVGHICVLALHMLRRQLFLNISQSNSNALDEIDVLGCDGTNTNTGWKGDILRKLGELTGINRGINLLHFTEMFPILFSQIDDTTSSLVS